MVCFTPDKKKVKWTENMNTTKKNPITYTQKKTVKKLLNKLFMGHKLTIKRYKFNCITGL